MRSSIGVPVSAESRLWGCMVVAFSRQGLLPLPADTEAQLAGTRLDGDMVEFRFNLLSPSVRRKRCAGPGGPGRSGVSAK